MVKNIICGIAVGIANIIPGVSGGTIIVILGLFDKLMNAISNVFKLKISFKERLENLWFIIQVLIGAAIGLIGFAKVLNFLFDNFELQTLAFFAGLILLSMPMLKKEELKNNKINYLFFILGILSIGVIAFLNPGDGGSNASLAELLSKNLTPMYITSLILLGAISGATMIFPGVSGSMVLLVLGWYHLFKGYVANVTTFELKILIPLVFIAIGVGIGIILSAKLTTFLLKKYKNKTISFILGLIIMSALVLFKDIDSSLLNTGNIITSIITFIIGGSLIYLLDKLKNNKQDKKSIRN